MGFKKFDISNAILDDLRKNNINVPTEVQEKVIPEILKGRDVMVQSETGSGKTIGFAVPTIEKIRPRAGVQILVIAPTRELAKQVAKEFRKFSKKKKLMVATVYGGVAMSPQIQKVGFSEIVVGTPGRLLDLLSRGALKLNKANKLVLDEADKLMEMGFIEDIDKIIRYMQRDRQTLLFSATINKRVIRIANRYLVNPVKILLENVIDKKLLQQSYYEVQKNDKISLLVHLLKNSKERALVFCNTKRMTRLVSSSLKLNNIDSDCINGDMSQHARERVLEKFEQGRMDVMVATDVASRGIHVEDITLVVNFDLPEDVDTYKHRIGRTARQGKKGTSLIFLSNIDYQKMDKIMQVFREFLNRKDIPEFERVRLPRRTEAPRRPYRSSQRRSWQGNKRRRHSR